MQKAQRDERSDREGDEQVRDAARQRLREEEERARAEQPLDGGARFGVDAPQPRARCEP